MGQRFYVDLSLLLDLGRAGQSDRLSDTVDYGAVYQMVKRIMEGAPCALIERAGAQILHAVLAEFPLVQAAEVTVHKPSAPVPGILQDVTVTMERQR